MVTDTREQVWGKSLLNGHVHSFAEGACRCGAQPSINRASKRTGPALQRGSAVPSKVVSE